MKRWLRVRIGSRPVFVALVLATTLVLGSRGLIARETAPREPEACSAVEPQGLTDETMRWRLRAYANLDCLIGRLEEASRQSSAKNGEIKMSREQVQQLLNLASWAKDAAQRIGH